MPWARIDDAFHSNAKVSALSDKAFRVYVNSITWSSQQLTNGVVPGHVLTQLCPNLRPDRAQKVTKELTDLGLFVPTDDGFEIHDFLDYQLSKTQVQQRRKANAERQARYKKRQGNAVSDASGVTPLVDDPIPSPTPIDRPSNEGLSRPRDELWDTFVEIHGDPASKSERGKFNKAVGMLRDAGVDAAEYPVLVAAYGAKYPDLQPAVMTVASRVGEMRHFVSRGPLRVPDAQVLADEQWARQAALEGGGS